MNHFGTVHRAIELRSNETELPYIEFLGRRLEQIESTAMPEKQTMLSLFRKLEKMNISI